MAVIIQNTNNQGVEYAVWHITESFDEILLLSQDIPALPQIQTLKSQARQSEKLIAWHLVNILCKEKKQIDYLPSGEPYLTDNSFKISISHTKNYVAVAIHPTTRVGIDIEFVGDRVLRVLNKFLTTNELDFINSSADRLHYSLLSWCAKEAVYKKIEHNTPDPPNDLVCKFNGNELQVDYKDILFDIEYMVNEEFYLVVC